MALELDERITQQLKDLYMKLEQEGELPSLRQLGQYYAIFHDTFGPEQLANLDGIALLEKMHNRGTKDSLVYWLEFKNDEEFPALFGSIAGGSAHKFGLFLKKETGMWTVGTPKAPREISVEEAIAFARNQRDQLIRGCELLRALPEHGSDAEYVQLQQDLERVAPDVQDTAWGHKYFSLLFPSKLDDFHNPEYARFHLVKLLQMPPLVEGRYVHASSYVALSHALDMPVHILTKLLNRRDGRNLHNYWRVGTSSSAGKPGEYWSEMRNGNYCAIGWDQLGDLSGIANDETGRQRISKILQEQEPGKPLNVINREAKQVFTFLWDIVPGDIVLVSAGERVLGVGRVVHDYYYEQSEVFRHRRPVEWLSLEEWKQPDIEGKLTTVYRMKRPANLIEAERHILNASISTVIVGGNGQLPTPPPRLTGIMARIQDVLERKGQVILYGPPGTGKTYWAEQTAKELAARACFGKEYSMLSLQEQMTIEGDGKNLQGYVRMCSFHPAYGYEDFMEGFRPEASNSQMQFVRHDGIFKKLCQDAACAPDKKFYLIIDEINRGDIPRIFGELLTVLEKEKRDKSILLPLSGDLFSVPNNVYIIGTMNTADRSIALLDTALRRRFGFIELMPDTSLLKYADINGIPLGPWLEALNERIRKYVGRDARNLQIGHAYFLKKGRPITNFATFSQIIKEDILPLLEEYCYEDYDRMGQIIGPQVVDVKAQVIRYALFEPSQRDILVQSLLEPFSEITTLSQTAVAEEHAREMQGTEGDEEMIEEEVQ